eukprot:1138467-Pelagomonas_calceolata.AAC.3
MHEHMEVQTLQSRLEARALRKVLNWPFQGACHRNLSLQKPDRPLLKNFLQSCRTPVYAHDDTTLQQD